VEVPKTPDSFKNAAEYEKAAAYEEAAKMDENERAEMLVNAAEMDGEYSDFGMAAEMHEAAAGVYNIMESYKLEGIEYMKAAEIFQKRGILLSLLIPVIKPRMKRIGT
jgi:hypothetical protein